MLHGSLSSHICRHAQPETKGLLIEDVHEVFASHWSVAAMESLCLQSAQLVDESAADPASSSLVMSIVTISPMQVLAARWGSQTLEGGPHSPNSYSTCSSLLQDHIE
jgi:hypothetical protein